MTSPAVRNPTPWLLAAAVLLAGSSPAALAASAPCRDLGVSSRAVVAKLRHAQPAHDRTPMAQPAARPGGRPAVAPSAPKPSAVFQTPGLLPIPPPVQA